MILILQRGGAEEVLRERAEQVFGQRHEITVVGIGLVKLQHGEFGIVDGRDAFIAKISIDFKHPLEPAHDQSFEVEFRRDAQVEVPIERVVVRHERAGRGSPGNGLHHLAFPLRGIRFR